MSDKAEGMLSLLVCVLSLEMYSVCIKQLNISVVFYIGRSESSSSVQGKGEKIDGPSSPKRVRLR